MDKRIEKALNAVVIAFEDVAGIRGTDFLAKLTAVFDLEDSYMDKVDLLDKCFDDQPVYEDLREVIFDLLLMNFFSADVEKLEEDYLESAEWERIEEQTIDRGTELLNLLLYLRECLDEEIEPDLDDFLKEFLLVDEDEFQDEYRIYEPMLVNQILTDSDYKEIARISSGLADDQELADLFYPMMSFFMDKNPSESQIQSYINASDNAAFDASVYALLTTYHKN